MDLFPGVRAFAKHFRLIALDLPGFGQSSHPEHLPYTLAQYSLWLKEFFDHLKLKKFYLLGNSMGGAIAMRVAMDYPNLIKGLILTGSAGVVTKDGHSFYDEFIAGNNPLSIESEEHFRSFINRLFYHPPYIPKFYLKLMFRQYYERNLWHQKMLLDLLSNGTHRPSQRIEKNHSFALNHELTKIIAPTLIIWGENDSLFPVSMGILLAQEIPKSDLVIMSKTGHCPQLERPKEFVKHLLEFLKKIN